MFYLTFLLFQKAHLGIGGVSFTYERSQAIQFSKIYIFSPLTFITPSPGIKPHIKLILEPFQITVWITILSVLLFIISVQKIIVYKIIKDKKADVTWSLISCLFKQGK